MSNYRRSLIIIALIILFSLAMIIAASQLVFGQSFTQIEARSVERSLQLLTNTLARERDQLSTQARDYAQWDDTYAYVADFNQDYIDSNFTADTFDYLNIQFVLILNHSGQLIFGRGFDPDQNVLRDPPAGLQPYLLTSSTLAQVSDSASGLAGYVLLEEGPALWAARPILTSEAGGPARGVLIFGRFLNAHTLTDLQAFTRLDFQIFRVDQTLSPEVQAFLETSESRAIHTLTDALMVGYIRLQDVREQPAAVLQVDLPRQTYQQGQASLRYFFFWLIVLAVAGLVAAWLLMRQLARAQASLLTANIELSQTLTRANELASTAEQANQTKTRFLANVTHELRTPLSGILGTLDLVLNEEKSNEAETRRLLQMAHHSSERMLVLVNDLLDCARIEAGKVSVSPEPVDLEPLLDENYAMLAPQAKAKGLDFHLRCSAANAPRVLADPNRLLQILRNLVGNAIKFTDRGSIVVSAEPDAENAVARIHVHDTGPGIPVDKQPLLFQPFVQLHSAARRKGEGVGLGLSISRQLAALMGGSLTLHSEGEGRGCTFTVTLPLAKG